MTSGQRTRVVVTGMGTVNPLGLNVEDFWHGLIEGRSTARTVTTYPTERLATKFACMLDGFDPLKFMDRRVAQRNARFTQIAVAAAQQALDDSALDLAREDPFRVGVEMGTGIGGFTELAEGAHNYYNGGRNNPLLAPMIIPNMAAGQIAMSFGLKGPNSTITTACAASTQSIGTAARTIEFGDADVMLAGGSEASLNPFGIGAFNAIRALSARNDDPEHASRPFDRDRDGFVPGEGAGMLVLESMEHAVNRGARIYGEMIGFGVTDDAHHAVAPDPTGAGPARCISNALNDARIQPEEIDYVNAHGTSTALNDAAETRALKMALGKHAYKVAISSTKSMIGHLLGAAGAVEAIAVLLTITRGIIHPTINYFNADPECDLDYVPNQARKADVRIAISNGFGFGGQNATAVFKRFEQ